MDPLIRSQCQHSLDLLVGREVEFAQSFFPLLFQRAPGLRTLFPKAIDDPEVQSQVLCQMMIAFVGNEDALLTGLRVVGFRLAMRDMLQDHCEVLANTFVGTLKRQLGCSWQSDFAYAWRVLKEEALAAMDDGASLMAA